MRYVRGLTLTAAFASAGILAAAIWSSVQAQGSGAQTIPPGHWPRPGECLVWYDDRPPGRQPRATDCASAHREARRTGGRVIYGDADPRYDRGRWDDDDRCIDRDRDGWCDWRERRPSECADRNRDGRCDYAARRYPSTLPDMVWAVIFGRGRRVAGVHRWLGTYDVRVRYTDRDRDGIPEQVTWLDSRGRLLQRWSDDNRDGRADRVAIFGGGSIVRVIR